MTNVYRYGGNVLRHGGDVAINQACCCEPCCPFPCDEIEACITNVDNCPCTAGICFKMVWDGVNNYWSGSPNRAGCGILGDTFQLACCDNPSAASPCENYCLSILEETGCIQDPQPAFPLSCSCDPFTIAFEFDLAGLGCCNGNPFNPSTIGVVIRCFGAAAALVAGEKGDTVSQSAALTGWLAGTSGYFTYPYGAN